MTIKNLSKFSILFLFLPLLLYGFFLLEKIDLTTSDLGRHLRNGEIFFKDFSVPETNIYSYTFPEFPFLNHHWLSGAIFFLIKKAAGFQGLHFFFILVSLVTLFLFFYLARRNSSWVSACLISLIAIPLLLNRKEIRPEIFSYLFSGLYFLILWNYFQEKISWRLLFLLPVIEVVWVNLHIFFFLGPFLIAVFLGGTILSLIFKKVIIKLDDFSFFSFQETNLVKKEKIFQLFLILILTLPATLLNPWFIQGALSPLRVYDNYGYRVLEEQSVWFLEKIINYPPAYYFKALFLFLVFSFGWTIYKKRLSVINLILAVAFSLSGWLMIRNFTLFAYFSIPLIAFNFNASEKKDFSILGTGSAILIFLSLFSFNYWGPRDLGLGLKKDNAAAAKFFLENNLKGPIFNNYDIGGYLTYYLYPQEKVFVDNRPNAYPSAFFQEIYIPFQEDNDFWKEKEKKFNFNSIFFFWRDATPWAQKFLIERINDSEWQPVYVDGKAIILLKNNELNKALIAKYKLPKEIFQTRKSQKI